MKTYQDLVALGDNVQARETFIQEVIREHKASELYRIAEEAEEYDRGRNTTIVNFRKTLVTMYGTRTENLWAANYRITSNFLNRFVTQQNQYLLGNGLNLEDKAKKEQLGFDFDMRLVDMGRNALVDGVSFGFWDNGRLRVFNVLEFAPIYDEENGALRAGVRFWQLDKNKPQRITFFEEDGCTEYLVQKDDGVIKEVKPKRPYLQIVQTSEADGMEIVEGANYPSFPIIPMWANEHKQSEFVGMKESIDCFDLIKSGFANNVDDASEIFWIIKNAGGMGDVELAQFLERVKTVKAASVDAEEGGSAEPHTVDIPYEARAALLERLERDMYNDFQAFNVMNVTAGKATATEINAAYQPFDNKVDKFEYCVFDFLGRLFALIGIDEEPKPFNRSKITNQLETTQMVLMAAQYLDDKTILSKLPWLSPEEVENILQTNDAEGMERFGAVGV